MQRVLRRCIAETFIQRHGKLARLREMLAGFGVLKERQRADVLEPLFYKDMWSQAKEF